MSGMVIDVSNVPVDLENIPDGNYMAEIVKAENALTSKGDPAINLVLRIEGSFGKGIIYDMLPSTFPRKVKSFYAAFNNYDPQEMAGVKNIEIIPEELIGGNVIIAFGTSERDGRTYHQVIPPFYFPDTRTEVLTDLDSPF